MTVTIKLPALDAWGELSLRCPENLWSRIRQGEFLQVPGQAWKHPSLKEGFVDVWAFAGGVGGLVSVRMVTPHRVHPKFCGNLHKSYIFSDLARGP